MADSKRSTPQQRQSWRAANTQQGLDPSVKRVVRVLLTVTAVGLLVLLGWLLIPPFFRSETHFVALPVVDYEVLDAPPIPFSREDVQGFAPLADLLARGREQGPVVLAELQTSEAMRSLLAGQLRNIVGRSKDALILYLSANGVSDAGSAYVLCSDFDPTRPDSGRQNVRDVLKQIASCPAAVKLVILDSGRIVADPRLGMMANEFPRLLETDVKATQDPKLWVIASHDLAETSQLSYALKRSRFAYVVNSALDGYAEADDNGDLGVGEVYDFVRKGVAYWAERAGEGQSPQTPVLLHGGEGRVATAPADVILLPARTVRPTPRLAATRRGARDAEPALPSGSRLNGGLALAQAPVPAEKQPEKATAPTPDTKPAEPKAPEPAPPAAAPAPVSTTSAPVAPGVAGLLTEAWRMRDRLADRDANGGWSPVDYAPHLWREFNELILGYEQRFRAGSAFDQQKLTDDLKKNILPLAERLKDSASTGGRSTIADRLGGAWHRFNASDLYAAYSREPSDLRRAYEMRNDSVFATYDYLRWLARASLLGGGDAAADDIEKLVIALTSLTTHLDAMRPAQPIKPQELQSLRDSLGSDMRELRTIRSSLDSRLRNEVETLARSPKRAGSTLRIEALLATTLLTADQRNQLFAALVESDQPAPDWDSDLAMVRTPPSTLDERSWNRLLTQMALQMALIDWAEAKGASLETGYVATLKSSLAAFMQARRDGDKAEANSWTALGAFGSKLGGVYRGLPRAIRDRENSSELMQPAERLDALRTAERMLRLVDPRDARLIDDSITIAPLPAAQKQELELILDSPTRFEIRSDEWTNFEIKVRSTSGLPVEYRPTIAFDAASVEARWADGQAPITSGVQAAGAAKSLDDRGEGVLRLQLRAKVEGANPMPMEVKLDAAGKAFTRSIVVVMPAADRIDLLVQGIAGTTASEQTLRGRWAADDEGTALLMPFPNRATTYRLALGNRSQRDRNVSVTLLASPRGAEKRRRQREQYAAEPTWPSAAYVKLHTIDKLLLPADGSPVLLSFVTPEPPAAAAPATPMPPAAPAAKDEKAEKIRPAIDDGLVCIIRDLDRKDRRWVKFIDTAVQPPRNYFDAEASYDRVQGRINLLLKPRDFDNDGRPDVDRMPPDGSTVQWEIGQELDPAAAMQVKSDAVAPKFEARLFADVPPDPGRNVDVRLTVDGYPRAFIWRVNCGNSESHLRPRRDLRQVRITSPMPGDAFRSPLDALPVSLEVDAPTDAFREFAEDDVLEVGLDATLDRSLDDARMKQFFSDRQVKFLLEGLEADGVMKIDTKVSDFKIELNPSGLTNTLVEIGARLTVGRNEPEKDFVQVALDGAPPKIDVTTQPTGAIVVQGVDLRVIVRGTDLSGIKKVEAAFDILRTGQIEKPELGVIDPASGLFNVLMPTKELKPGNYILLVRATDKVDLLSTPTRIPVTVRAPAGPPPPVKPQNSITGTIRLNGSGQAGVTVELTGAAAKTAVSDASGAFAFRDLMPGAYKVSAKGAVKNRFREAKPVDVILEAAPKPPASVVLELE